MSVIIRLQNLPWSANALDIRGFFKGLGIPEGGVHIVGGEMGDAFIAFSTDEDARQAMTLDRGKLKEVQVRLLLSSRAEMQKVIETARQVSGPFTISQPIVTPSIQIQPPIITSSLSGMLSQQIMQRERQQQMPVLSTDSLKRNVSNLSNATLSQLQQQQQNLTNALLSNDNSLELENEKDRKKENERRDRSRKSRSRSRDRSRRSHSRSRSRERGGVNRRRRNRSRSQDRDRDRRTRRSHRSSSQEKSRDCSRDRSRDRNINRGRSDRNSVEMTPEMLYGPSMVTYPNKNLKTAVWDLNPKQTTEQQNINLSKTYNVDESLNKSDEMRNTRAFPIAQEPSDNTTPIFTSNTLYSSNTNRKAVSPFKDKLALGYNVNSKNPAEGKCVKLSKLNLITGYGEIRRFFCGLQINQNGIKMINDKNGRRTGVAYVRFLRYDSKRVALLKSGQELRDTKVEVTTISEDDFDDATDSFKPVYNYNRGSYRSDEDNDDDYDDDDRDSDDSYRERDRRRERNKNDENEVNKAHSDDDLQIISNTSQDESNDNAKTKDNVDDDDDDIQILLDPTDFNKPSKDKTTLLIKDIPPFTKEQDVIKIFSNYTLVHILICKNHDGTKANYAYAKFHRAVDAKAALNDRSTHLIAYKAVTVTSVDDDVYDKDRNAINADINLLNSELLSSNAKQSSSYNNNNKDNANPEFGENTNKAVNEFPSDPRLQQRNTTYTSNDPTTNTNNVNSYLLNQFDNSNSNVWNQQPSLNFSNNNSQESGISYQRKDPRLSRFSSITPTSVAPLSEQASIEPYPLNNFTNILSNNDTNQLQQSNARISDPRQRMINQGMGNTTSMTVPSRNFEPNFTNQNLIQTNCVALYNLEYKTTERDVIDFFSDIGAIPLRIHILLNVQGDPSGDCLCEFSTNDDARRALSKNFAHLGMNSITVQLISQQEAEHILNSFKDEMIDRSRNRDRKANDNYYGGNNSNNSSNSSFRGNNNQNFRGNFGGNRNYNNRGNNNMNRGSTFHSNNNQNSNTNHTANIRSLFSIPPSSFVDIDIMPTTNLSNNSNSNSRDSNQGRAPDLGTNGCIVSLANVPYRAGVDDILNFFKGFMLSKQDVMRRYNDKGAPTGDARVCFESPQEAKRAIEEKRYGKIFTRTIHLELFEDM